MPPVPPPRGRLLSTPIDLMTEPQRTEPVEPVPSTEAEREALIERLLLAGLDHYFAGKHEQAINIWTRVAFLEGGHGRARAYIERARGALAESQRRSEELVHTGVAAYHAGDLQTARELLNRALDEGGANETALVFLQRLSRLEAAASTPQGLPARRSFIRSRRDSSSPSAATNWLTTILASAAVAGAILMAAQPVASWLVELPVAEPAIQPGPPDPLPVVRSGEMRLARARELYADGRLRDALRLLDGIGIADPLRPEADRLEADVQRDLLNTVVP
jgi:tetratricopeptide (TPR) repeat protein